VFCTGFEELAAFGVSGESLGELWAYRYGSVFAAFVSVSNLSWFLVLPVVRVFRLPQRGARFQQMRRLVRRVGRV